MSFVNVDLMKALLYVWEEDSLYRTFWHVSDASGKMRYKESAHYAINHLGVILNRRE
jgi:hypothetical protein